MTVAAAPRLTLADAQAMIDNAVKDRSYVDDTSLGRDVDHFLTYFVTERGKTANTCRSYEYCLARLAVKYSGLTLTGFDGKHGTNLIRDFLRDTYADVQGGTWNTRVATIKAFFKWAFEEGRIDHNPAAMIRYRSVPESERKAHSVDRIQLLVIAQPDRRDRIAVQLLGRLALRRNELRLVQMKHIDTETREILVFGKGGTVKRLPIVDDLLGQIIRERLDRSASPDEYLLYPMKRGRIGVHPHAHVGVIWENRLAPLSLSGIDKWWARCVKRASLEAFPMHELRHSAGTNFWRETRDLRMTQRLMRHKSIRTTADTYLHDDPADLSAAFEALPAWEIEQ